LSRNVCKKLPLLAATNPAERSSQLLRGDSPIPRTAQCFPTSKSLLFLRNSLPHAIDFFFSLCVTTCSIELIFLLLLLNISRGFSSSCHLSMRFLILLYALTTFFAPLFTFFFFYLPPYFCHSLCNITHVIKFLFSDYVGLILQTVNYF